MSSDVCRISGPHFFIRCILEVQIIGAQDPFTWGIWVTQSETNFAEYLATLCDSPDRVTFGYFANRLPLYPDTLSLHTLAHWRDKGSRPWIEIGESDHPLFDDYKNGISWDRAVELAASAHRH